MKEMFVELMNDRDFVITMLSQETPEDVQKLYASHGVELTMEDVAALGKTLESFEQASGELGAEDLDGVSGGVALTVSAWGIAKAVIAVGAAGVSLYKWYKSR